MVIAAILLWMAMQGQAQHDPHAVQYAFVDGCWITYNEAADTLPGIPCVSSAEHIIEIKAKREITAKVCQQWPETNTIVRCECPYDYREIYHPENFAAQCERSRREIWIDGVKWGVLKVD